MNAARLLETIAGLSDEGDWGGDLLGRLGNILACELSARSWQFREGDGEGPAAGPSPSGGPPLSLHLPCPAEPPFDGVFVLSFDSPPPAISRAELGCVSAALRSAVDKVLARFELAEAADRLIGHLSKGFQQRVSLAQAFLGDPPLVIVDEPTIGLDPVQQEEVRGVLRGLRGQRTLILCTHDLGEARELTDRVAILHRGRLVATGPTEDVLGNEDSLSLFRGENGDPP